MNWIKKEGFILTIEQQLRIEQTKRAIQFIPRDTLEKQFINLLVLHAQGQNIINDLMKQTM